MFVTIKVSGMCKVAKTVGNFISNMKITAFPQVFMFVYLDRFKDGSD